MSGSSQYETHQGTGSSGARTVTAMFQSRSDAERAVERLVSEGFSRDDVRMMPGSERDVDTGASGATRHSEGFWESLADFFFPDSDRDVYAEGLSRGGFLVSVSTTTSNHDRAIDILDDDGTIDLDEQESAWRSQGWSGRSGSSSTSGMDAGYSSDAGLSGAGLAGTGGSAMAGSDTSSTSRGTATGLGGSTAPASDRMAGSSLGTVDDEDISAGSGRESLATTPNATPGMGAGTGTAGASGMAGTLGSTASGAGADYGEGSRTGGLGIRSTGSGTQSGLGSDRRTDGREEVIPVAEEELRVGKRDVEGGRVRVRSYVVETPVEQQVSLRREHVDIQRRPVDRPLTAGEDAFRDRTVELEERAEQPVVSKEARIREEVVVNKDVDTEQRTVSDTVRRTEVEVDDQRGSDARRRANEGDRKL